MAAPLHFLVGSTGAGKTTYARRFCADTGAVHFSIDEWMSALFWMDSPQPLQPAWSIERVERCSRQIWGTAVRVAAAGVPCLLEMGFGRAETRARYAAAAVAAGLAAELLLLDVPVAERWRRVEARNAAGGQLAFPITRDLFDFTEGHWEPPTDDEMARLSGRRVAS